MSDQNTDTIEGNAVNAPPSTPTIRATFDTIAERAISKVVANRGGQPGAAPSEDDEQELLDSEADTEDTQDGVDFDEQADPDDVAEGGNDEGDEDLPPGYNQELDPGDEDDAGAPSKDPKTVSKKVFDKRIAKATRRIKGLETEKDELQQRVNTLQQTQAASAVDPNNPVSGATTTAELDKYAEQASSLADQVQQMQLQVKRDPERVQATLAQQGIQTDDPELWLEEQALHLSKITSRTIPARRTFVAEREKHVASAESKYPWLTDPSDPRTQWVQEKKAQYPGATALVPDLELMLARSVVQWHREADEARAAPKKGRRLKPTRQAGAPQAGGGATAQRRVPKNRTGDAYQEAVKQKNAKPYFDSLATKLIKDNGLLKRR